MRRLAPALLALTFVVSGCGGGDTVSPSDLLAVWAQDGTPGHARCADGGGAIEGVLVTRADLRIAVAESPRGHVRSVSWPPGYAARRDGTGLILVDEEWDTVARLGDRVRVRGEMGPTDGVWFACPQIAVLPGR